MKTIRSIFIVVIMLGLMAPSVLMLAGVKNANRENRPLASMPKLFNEKGLNTDFAPGFDEYVDDHFALREHLVNSFNTISASVLKDTNSTEAVIGNDSHILFAKTVNDYLGVDQLNEEQIGVIAAYLSDVAGELEARGIGFVFITAPNKASVYPEAMPGYLKPVDTPRNIDMLNAALKEKDVPFIDAKALLIGAKAIRPVYYKHDSHWNNYGAALVYNSIADAFGLERFDAETFTVKCDRTGDLHNFIYPTSDYYEDRFIYPHFHEYRSSRPINFERDRKVETTSGVNSLKMVVLHDSFGRSLQPFLSQSVGSLYMNSVFPYNIDYVLEIEPDFVVIELVERNLSLLYDHAKTLGY